MEPDDKLWHLMSKKVQHGTSGVAIYHRVTQFYHRVPPFFIWLCNFSTRLQIPQVPILNTGLHLYRQGPAWSVICTPSQIMISPHCFALKHSIYSYKMWSSSLLLTSFLTVEPTISLLFQKYNPLNQSPSFP